MLLRRLTSSSADTTDEGPFVLGYAMCFGLMGVLFAHCFIYFTKFPNDRAWIRVLVDVVLLLETLITIFALHGFWVGVTDHNSDLSSIVTAGVGG
ncbi:hypothetical protein OG21DRAFT_1484305 [Imleria badia]|nr:hypothetical protein OG21DRAFT_1484305 [Imleria badia]